MKATFFIAALLSTFLMAALGAAAPDACQEVFKADVDSCRLSERAHSLKACLHDARDAKKACRGGGDSQCDTESQEQVTGTLLSLGVVNFIVSPDADTVCGVSSNQLFVTLADDVELLTVVITDVSSVITPGGSLEVGQTIGMNGSCEIEGYTTDNVVIVDDQR